MKKNNYPTVTIKARYEGKRCYHLDAVCIAAEKNNRKNYVEDVNYYVCEGPLLAYKYVDTLIVKGFEKIDITFVYCS